MISFLRKSRKELTSQGKLRQYIFYALGEMILVVAGILIALSINTWNERKKEKAAELEIDPKFLQRIPSNSKR